MSSYIIEGIKVVFFLTKKDDINKLVKVRIYVRTFTDLSDPVTIQTYLRNKNV